MILMTACLIKVFVLLAVLLAGYRMLRGKTSAKEMLGMGCLVLIAAYATNALAELLPPLTDEVILTALGENRDEARAAEIYLAGYTVDGKEFLAGESMDVIAGKWFWNGDTYCWRIETDTRQPEGTTRSITVRIPVGWERTLNFRGDVWRGMVEISWGGNSCVIDTYLEEGGIVSKPLGRSDTSVLILNQVRYLSVYAGIMLLLLCAMRTVCRNWEKVCAWNRRNTGRLIYAGIALATFFFMFKSADAQSLWNDEILRIENTAMSLSQGIEACLQMRDASPPLFTLCAHFWYRIAPYGEQWLLLISIVPVVIAVFIIGVSGEMLAGKATGIITAILVATSTTVWGYAAYEYSSYAMMIFFTTLCIFSHIKKSQTAEKTRWLVTYSISLLGLAMSHYFGMLACAEFLAADIALFMKRKVTWRSAWTYVMPGVGSLIWMVLVWQTTLQYRGPEDIANWYGIPGLYAVRDVLRFLSGNVDLVFLMLLLGLGCCLVICLDHTETGKIECYWEKFYLVFSVMAVVGTLLLLVTYGRYINQESTMWQSRYFLFLVPFVALIVALSIHFWDNFGTETMVLPTEAYHEKIIAAFLGFYLSLNCVILSPSCGYTQPFRDAADWLYTQSNSIFNDDTIIITLMGYSRGLQDYYITRRGVRDPLNVVNQWEVNKEKLQSYNMIYLQYTHGEFSNELRLILEQDFTLQNDISNVQVKVYVRKT